MFSTGGWKQKAGLMALGSIFTIIGMFFAIGMLPSVTAQRDKFGDIECTSLRVVDAAGKVREILTTNIFEGTVDDNIKVRVIGSDIGGGAVVAIGGDLSGGESRVSLGIDGRGGVVTAFGKDGGMVSMGMDINKHGGRVTVSGKDGESKAVLGIGDHGGEVYVFGKDEESRAALKIAEHGGVVAVVGKDGESQALLNIIENGGHVGVFGKDEGKAIMGIDQYGNGAVYTWDKNGNRQ